MTELFPEAEVRSLSPRLKWMQQHGIRTQENDPELEFNWDAWTGNRHEAIIKSFEAFEQDAICDCYATGKTEEEALAKLARAKGLKLWNEEG